LGGGGGTATAAFDGGKIGEGSGNFGVRGQWIESREDGGGGGVLELRQEGAK
jgi:hypothetical protein